MPCVDSCRRLMLALWRLLRAPAPTLRSGPGLAEKRVSLPDDRPIRIVLAGSGNPLVVFEAGLGLAASMRGRSTPRRTETRTLAYDRAGLGGSDAAPRSRALARHAYHLDLPLYDRTRGTGGAGRLQPGRSDHPYVR